MSILITDHFTKPLQLIVQIKIYKSQTNKIMRTRQENKNIVTIRH
jgi:hypothetical protein